jgi:hypothetical protein
MHVAHDRDALCDSYIVSSIHDATESYYERGKYGLMDPLQEIRSIATNKIVETSAKSSQLVPVASKSRSLGSVASKRVELG